MTSTLHAAATPEKTAARAALLGPYGAASLGTTGLTVTRVGFGGYRVDDRDPVFAAALARALRAGCNLVDTSTNYTDGGSERCVGNVLGALAASAEVEREGVVVVSKAGYVQGQNLDLAVERERAGRPFPEMVKVSDGCWHCIHPAWLEDQIDRSLRRLRLETLDICLLHNPEYFLADAHERTGGPIETRREELYHRMAAAFAFFESQVAAGRLRFYGVSSNTVAHAEDDPEATSLERMLEAARAGAGPDNHFRVLQLPLNLLESAAAVPRREAEVTVLELAQRLGIGVLANRPLNAIRGGRVLRLAGAMNAAMGPLLDPTLPVELRGAPLSQKVLAVLASTPGVSSVLVGMRRTAYVDDALAAVTRPPLPDARAAYLPFVEA